MVVSDRQQSVPGFHEDVNKKSSKSTFGSKALRNYDLAGRGQNDHPLPRLLALRPCKIMMWRGESMFTPLVKPGDWQTLSPTFSPTTAYLINSFIQSINSNKQIALSCGVAGAAALAAGGVHHDRREQRGEPYGWARRAGRRCVTHA